jgi:hypothetical protein
MAARVWNRTGNASFAFIATLVDGDDNIFGSTGASRELWASSRWTVSST